MTDGTDRQPASTALIVGCGYLGRRLAAQLIAQQVTVFGTTRHDTHARQLAAMGVRPLLVEVTQPVTLAALRPVLEADQLDVYYLIPPGRPGGQPTIRQVILEGLGHVLRALKRATVGRAVLTSTTAVYGQSDSLVDADTPPSPLNERTRMLVQAEQHWLAAGQGYHVVRLAGLYGPGRVIGLSAIREGAPIIGNPQAHLNLLHVDDAANLLIRMTTAPKPGPIELGCDDQPPSRLDYYRTLAELIHAPQPAVLDDAAAAAQFGLDLQRLMRTSSKRCDNRLTRQRTGWQPQFPDFRQGLADAFARSRTRGA